MKAMRCAGLLLGSFLVPVSANAQLLNNPLYSNVPVNVGPQPESRVLSINREDRDYCEREARKKFGEPGCVYFVNLSKHQILEFWLAFANDEDGRSAWSRNQFVAGYPFESNRYTPYRKPKDHGCFLIIRYVMMIKGKKTMFEEAQNVCGPPPDSLMTINPKKGTVTVDMTDLVEPASPQTSEASPPPAVAAIAPTSSK